MQNSTSGRTARTLTNFLLTLFSAAVIWAAKELNSVDARLASMEAAFKIRVYELSDVRKKEEQLSINLADLVIRVSKLEFINDQKNHTK